MFNVDDFLDEYDKLKELQKVYIEKLRASPDAEKTEKEEIGEILEKPKFKDLIFEPNVKEILKILIPKIKEQNINLLLYGQQGTGKTSTAKMLAVETNRPFIYINGNMSKKKIVEILLNSKNKSIVLIDEIHNLPDSIAEVVYPAIQDNEVYFEGKKKKIDLMFVGTTTEPENLPKPLLDRFHQIEFEELDEEFLLKVLEKRGIPNEVAVNLLKYTTNLRILDNLIELIKMYGEINLVNLNKVFRLKKINMYSGLSVIQEKYLELLKEKKKVSLRNFSLYLRKSEDYIKYEVEPDLVRKNLIFITSRGRELNPEVKEFSFSQEELEKEAEKKHSTKSIDEMELARQFLNDNPHIKKKFGKRYLELVNFIADKIAEGIYPDEIDFDSFGTDLNIEESYKNNYIDEL